MKPSIFLLIVISWPFLVVELKSYGIALSRYDPSLVVTSNLAAVFPLPLEPPLPMLFPLPQLTPPLLLLVSIGTFTVVPPSFPGACVVFYFFPGLPLLFPLDTFTSLETCGFLHVQALWPISWQLEYLMIAPILLIAPLFFGSSEPFFLTFFGLPGPLF